MLRGLFGRTGGGKTMTLMRELIKVLLETERFCVTNLQEIQLGPLNEYLQKCRAEEAKKHPSRARPPVDLDKRLLIIPKQETRHFYRYRSGGLVLPIFEDVDKTGKRKPLEQFNVDIEAYFAPVWSKIEYAKGVEYFMSECHRFFPAREYQNFARPMNFWATQNRHFDDNCWIESQFPMQIDSNFRELAVEWYHVRNHGREVMGWFKQRSVFSWRMYYALPKSEKDEPADKGEFKLDAAGVGSTYKTRGAVSALAESSPETPPKNKKLPFWALPVMVVVGIVLAGCALAVMPKLAQVGIAKAVGSVSGAASQGMKEGLGVAVAPRVAAPPMAAGPAQAMPLAESRVHHAALRAEPKPTGWARTADGRVFVSMSDGSRRWFAPRYAQYSDKIGAITPVFVELDGVKTYLAPQPERPRPLVPNQPTITPMSSPALPAVTFEAPRLDDPASDPEPSAPGVSTYRPPRTFYGESQSGRLDR